MKDMAEAVCEVSTVKRIIQEETWLATSNLDEALRRSVDDNVWDEECDEV